MPVSKWSKIPFVPWKLVNYIILIFDFAYGLKCPWKQVDLEAITSWMCYNNDNMEVRV